MTDATVPNVGIETITPALAAAYLKTMIKNRPLRRDRVESLRRDIVAGNFLTTGDTLKFDERGRLMDGQHRCLAIEESGRTVLCAVARGVKSEAVDVIDQGAGRTTGDMFHMAGDKYANALAGAASLVFCSSDNRKIYQNGNFRVTHNEAKATVEAFPELRDSVYFTGAIGKRFIKPSTAAALHFLFGRVDREKANYFFEKLSSGEDLQRDSSILLLRNLLMDNQASNKKYNSTTVLALIIKAWNRFYLGLATKSLRWRQKNEEFPEIVEFAPLYMGIITKQTNRTLISNS